MDKIARLKSQWKRVIRVIEAYCGTVLLPFEPGGFKRAAVKIVDDRGLESLKIVEM